MSHEELIGFLENVEEEVLKIDGSDTEIRIQLLRLAKKIIEKVTNDRRRS
jgi:hypothetical protein